MLRLRFSECLLTLHVLFQSQSTKSEVLRSEASAGGGMFSNLLFPLSPQLGPFKAFLVKAKRQCASAELSGDELL